MNTETKAVLKRSINDFLVASDNEQEEMIYRVQEKIKMHEKGLKSVGFGYAEHYVQAGKIFLRIYNQ